MRVRRSFALLSVVVVALVAAAPAGAINDPRVPGDECSGHADGTTPSAAVGDPVGGNPGILGPSPIQPPASLFNAADDGVPGKATGAKAVDRSHAFDICPNNI
jgi:hypothetical protein